MSKRFDAVVAGHICLDLIPGFHEDARSVTKSLFTPGHLTEVGKAVVSPGGPVANTGIALHKLGTRTKLMGKIGQDLFGKAICEAIALNGEELISNMIKDDRVNTSYTVILSPSNVDRIFFHYPGANDTFNVDDIRLDIVSQARLFHFGYPPIMRCMYENSGRQLAELFGRIKKTGVTTSLDMTLPDPASGAGKADWKCILRATLPYVDIFLPSLEEILFMLKCGEFKNLPETIPPSLLSNISRELIDMGAKIVGIKLGNQGFYIRTAQASALKDMGNALPQNVTTWENQQLWAPCFKVNVCGTTGAGDATIAGFLSALLRDCSIKDSATMAVATGACCVEAADATNGIRSWDNTSQRINAGWSRRDLLLADSNWHWLTHDQIWSTK